MADFRSPTSPGTNQRGNRKAEVVLAKFGVGLVLLQLLLNSRRKSNLQRS